MLRPVSHNGSVSVAFLVVNECSRTLNLCHFRRVRAHVEFPLEKLDPNASKKEDQEKRYHDDVLNVWDRYDDGLDDQLQTFGSVGGQIKSISFIQNYCWPISKYWSFVELSFWVNVPVNGTQRSEYSQHTQDLQHGYGSSRQTHVTARVQGEFKISVTLVNRALQVNIAKVYVLLLFISQMAI